MIRTSRAHPLEIGVTSLLRRPGVRVPLHTEVNQDGLVVGETSIPSTQPIELDLVLEAQGLEVTVGGSLRTRYAGTCRRCLEPVDAPIEVEVQEVFERNPTEGETYPLEGETIDLEPLVRDALLLALPLAPLCREECAGPVPERYPATVEVDETPLAEDVAGSPAAVATATVDDADPPLDPRWAALRGLRLSADAEQKSPGTATGD